MPDPKPKTSPEPAPAPAAPVSPAPQTPSAAKPKESEPKPKKPSKPYKKTKLTSKAEVDRLTPAIDKVFKGAQGAAGAGSIPVNYCYTFHTSWTNDLKPHRASIKKWEQERMLYSIIIVSNRFTIHTQRQKSLTIRNHYKDRISGRITHTTITTLQQVYMEFSDSERQISIEQMKKYTDPLSLLKEMGL